MKKITTLLVSSLSLLITPTFSFTFYETITSDITWTDPLFVDGGPLVEPSDPPF